MNQLKLILGISLLLWANLGNAAAWCGHYSHCPGPFPAYYGPPVFVVPAPVCYAPPLYPFPGSITYTGPGYPNFALGGFPRPVGQPVVVAPKKTTENPEEKMSSAKDQYTDLPRIPKAKQLITDEKDPFVLPKPKKVEEKMAKGKTEEFLVENPTDKPGMKDDLVKVNFFNHRDDDVIISINDESIRLEGGRWISVNLPRQFKWQEQGRTVKQVDVPLDSAGLEIVFRK